MNRTQELFSLVSRSSDEQVFNFLKKFHRSRLSSVDSVLRYRGTIDDEIDFIDGKVTKHKVTSLMIAVGKGFIDKTKILLVHGANPNIQCGTGDTALNIAAHRGFPEIVDLLLEYGANPNLSNQAGKTTLHRAVVSYSAEQTRHLKTLFEKDARTTIVDHNGRTPMDEAVLHDRTDALGALISHDKNLVQNAQRSMLIAARLGHDRCLQILLRNGVDPDVSDDNLTTPLQTAVRADRFSTAELLKSAGADPKRKNRSDESAISLAEKLPAESRKKFLQILEDKSAVNFRSSIGVDSRKSFREGNELIDLTKISSHPLLKSKSNWTFEHENYRSDTGFDSNVENLLDPAPRTFWCCTKPNNAWVVFDLKTEHEIAGIRLIGNDDQSTVNTARLEVSNSLHGPWLSIYNIECPWTLNKKEDFKFSPVRTRFIRLFITKNHGAPTVRIRFVGFFGFDLRLVRFLNENRLEKYLRPLLSQGINDLEKLEERRDEILNCSDPLYNLDDYFRFSKLIESLKTSELTSLEWLELPQPVAYAGDRLRTFSVYADRDLNSRLVLQQFSEFDGKLQTVAFKDLEPVQDVSVADFSEFSIENPGQYKIRVISLDSPQIQTAWWPITISVPLSYSSEVTQNVDERLYLSSATRLSNDTATDNENNLLIEKRPTTASTRSFLTDGYQSNNDDTNEESYSPSTENQPKMMNNHQTERRFSAQMRSLTDDENDDGPAYNPDHYTQTNPKEVFDQTTITNQDSDNEQSFDYRVTETDKFITPTRYRLRRLSNMTNNYSKVDVQQKNPKQRKFSSNSVHDDGTMSYGERVIIPTKYKNSENNTGTTKRMYLPERPMSPTPEKNSKPRKFDESPPPEKANPTNHNQNQISSSSNFSPIKTLPPVVPITPQRTVVRTSSSSSSSPRSQRLTQISRQDEQRNTVVHSASLSGPAAEALNERMEPNRPYKISGEIQLTENKSSTSDDSNKKSEPVFDMTFRGTIRGLNPMTTNEQILREPSPQIKYPAYQQQISNQNSSILSSPNTALVNGTDQNSDHGFSRPDQRGESIKNSNSIDFRKLPPEVLRRRTYDFGSANSSFQIEDEEESGGFDVISNQPQGKQNAILQSINALNPYDGIQSTTAPPTQQKGGYSVSESRQLYATGTTDGYKVSQHSGHQVFSPDSSIEYPNRQQVTNQQPSDQPTIGELYLQAHSTDYQPRESVKQPIRQVIPSQPDPYENEIEESIRALPASLKSFTNGKYNYTNPSDTTGDETPRNFRESIRSETRSIKPTGLQDLLRANPLVNESHGATSVKDKNTDYSKSRAKSKTKDDGKDKKKKQATTKSHDKSKSSKK